MSQETTRPPTPDKQKGAAKETDPRLTPPNGWVNGFRVYDSADTSRPTTAQPYRPVPEHVVIIDDEIGVPIVTAGIPFVRFLYIDPSKPDYEVAATLAGVSSVDIVPTCDVDGGEWAGDVVGKLERIGISSRVRNLRDQSFWTEGPGVDFALPKLKGLNQRSLPNPMSLPALVSFLSDRKQDICAWMDTEHGQPSGVVRQVRQTLRRSITSDDIRGLALAQNVTVDEEWPIPVPPWTLTPESTPFPEGILTGASARLAEATVESAKVPMGLVAPVIIGMHSLAGQRLYRVESPTYTINSIAATVVIVAPTGSGKSAAMGAPTAALYRWLSTRREELEVIAEELADDDESAEKPSVPRYVLDNGTAEAVRRAMGDGPVGVISSEGGRQLRIINGMYSRGAPDPSVFIKGYDGDYLAAEARAGLTSGSEAIAWPRLTNILATHDGTLAELGPAFDEQGYMARALISRPAPRGRINVRELKAIPSEVREEYERHYHGVLEHTAEAAEDIDDAVVLTLNPKATDLYWDAFQRYSDAREDGDLPAFHARAHEHVLRVAAALWLVDGGWKRGTELSASQVERAVRLVDYHAANQRALFVRNTESAAQRLWSQIKATKGQQANKRELQRSSPLSADDFNQALAELEAGHMVKVVKDGRKLMVRRSPRA